MAQMLNKNETLGNANESSNPFRISKLLMKPMKLFVVRYLNDSKFVNIWFIFGGLMRILSKCSQRFEPKEKVDNIHLRRSETLNQSAIIIVHELKNVHKFYTKRLFACCSFG
jgi:hypothetical protein